MPNGLPRALMRNCRILIVDDVEVNRKILRAMYMASGFVRLEEAESGEAALERVRTWRPHLILLDLMMPGIDGIEVCQRMREMTLDPRPIIIAQTVLTDLEHRSRLLQAGGNDFMNKPIDQDELIERSFLHLEKNGYCEED